MTIGGADAIQSSQAMQQYGRDYVGGVQLLQDSGFDPFSERSPVRSALNQVFADFSRRLPGGSSAVKLEEGFLADNAGVRRAVGLYDALDKAFSPAGPGGEAPVVSYLNKQVDEYVKSRDQNGDNLLSTIESGLAAERAAAFDFNRDNQLSGAEIKRGVLEGNSPLQRILGYFNNPPGQVVDLYA
jgi:hypothetical protein